jgi:hypothetical protein
MNMRLNALAGFGPTAAFVSGGSMLVALFTFIFAPAVFQNNFGLEIVFAIFLLLAMTLWPAALLVVGVDLEWLEHEATHTGWMQASLIAGFIAIFLPVLFVLSVVFAGTGNLPSLPIGLLGVALGFFLWIQNREARKAGLLHGVLPVIGLISGVAFLVMGVSFLLTFVFAGFFLTALLGWFVGTISYCFWSIWLGVFLQSAKQLPTVAPAPGATA